MARAKAIAPDGPAEFKIVKLFQISGRAPIFKIAHTTNGSNRSFIITTKETDFVGIIEWKDKITPSAKSVKGAAAAPENFIARATGSGVEKLNKFANTPKHIAINTGFLTSLSKIGLIGSGIFLAVQIISIFVLGELIGVNGVAIALVLGSSSEAIFLVSVNRLIYRFDD